MWNKEWEQTQAKLNQIPCVDDLGTRRVIQSLCNLVKFRDVTVNLKGVRLGPASGSSL